MTRLPFSFDAKLLGLAVCLSLPLATFAADPVATTTQDLHKSGKYGEVVEQGRSELRLDPKNYELRFMVADSLQRIGKIEEATLEFQALGGTPLAEAATFRLNALGKRAQAVERQSAAADRKLATSSSTPLLVQYQYVPPVNAALTGSKQPVQLPQPAAVDAQAASTVAPQKSTDEQKILELNAAQDYAAVGTAGLELLSKASPDESLQLIIANSLAWSGRLKEAAPTYQGLVNGKYANEAKVGLANTQRWQGRDDKAMPLYQEVVAVDPSNKDALEGIELATRELAPRTTLSVGRAQDTGNVEHRSATVTHRWRDRSGANIMEIETGAVRDASLVNQATQQDVTLRYQALGLTLKPSLELSIPTKADRSLYGKAHLTFEEYRASLDVGRVNWGKLAINPNALEAHLAASTIGFDITQGTPLGDVTARVDYFDISDGNNLVTSSLRLASSWRPLGSHIKPFMGIETRDVSFNTPNYWSPKDGFGTAYVGLVAEWGQANWDWLVAGQIGAPLYGEAGNSWSLSTGGRRWISRDWALGVKLWSLESVRDKAMYGAQGGTITLDKLWR